MKSIRRALSRSATADGPRTPPSRPKKVRSPMRRTRTGGSKSPARANETSAEIFCNDMYTIDFVLDSLEDVARNDRIQTVVLEDLIERDDATITQAVHDMLVQTTLSAKMDGESGEATTMRKSSSSSNLRKSSSSSSNFLSGTASSHGKKSKRSNKSKIKRRVWKKIVFVDCISDSASYKNYLAQKRSCVAALTRFLRDQGFQNDLPIRFEAKIEIHTMLEGPTILELLQSIQRDTSVTRVEFGGALSHTRRHIAEEFEKLIDEEEWTVTETVTIRLHYDKQSLNMEDSFPEDDNSFAFEYDQPQSGRRRHVRRQSQLDAEVLMMIRRMAVIMEQKMMPNDLDSAEITAQEMSLDDKTPNKNGNEKKEKKEDKPSDSSSEGGNEKRPKPKKKKKKDDGPTLDIFGNPIEESKSHHGDDNEDGSGRMNNASRMDRRRGKDDNNVLDESSIGGDSTRRPRTNKQLDDASSVGGDRTPRRNRSSDAASVGGTRRRAVLLDEQSIPRTRAKMKRSVTMDENRASSKGSPKRSAPKRSVTVDESFWEKGLSPKTKKKLESEAAKTAGTTNSKQRSSSPSPPGSPKKATSPPASPKKSPSRTSSPTKGSSPSSKTKTKSSASAMTARQKEHLLDSVNSVSAPPLDNGKVSLGKEATKKLMDDSSKDAAKKDHSLQDLSDRSTGSQKKGKNKKSKDAMTDDSCSSFKTCQSEVSEKSTTSSKKAKKKKKSADDTSICSENSTGSKKKKKDLPSVSPTSLKRSNSDTPPKKDATTTAAAASLRRVKTAGGVRRSLSFESKERLLATNPDFDWADFTTPDSGAMNKILPAGDKKGLTATNKKVLPATNDNKPKSTAPTPKKRGGMVVVQQ